MTPPETLTWSEIRAQTIERFRGQTPRAEDEQTIIDTFETSPLLVLQAIDDIATADVTWHWSALAGRLKRTPIRDATVDIGPSKTKLIQNAQRWIRNTGHHIDRQEELIDELYGDRGTLRPWKDDQPLRTRMLALWQEVRPIGEQLEHDETHRAQEWLRVRQEIADKKSKHATQPT